jgi:thioredoxin reductase (NADPH)
MIYDLLIIGAGPAGLACAIEATKKKLSYTVIDKGCAVNSIYRFPADMVFFSTPELLSIGELVFVSQNFRPNRIEALNYYRAVIAHYQLSITPYEAVTQIVKREEQFKVSTTTAHGGVKTYAAKKVIVATGYYDHPNRLMVEGGNLPQVSHYFTEAHPFHDRDVVVIGGKNSAVEAALTLHRVGARTTLIHRGATLSSSVKYWVRPEIDKRIESGGIPAFFDTTVTAIRPGFVDMVNHFTGTTNSVAADHVFALTGYHPDQQLLASAGVSIDPESLAPTCDPVTLETNVPGLYVAGSIVAGKNCNTIFIENSRDHGKFIVDSA